MKQPIHCTLLQPPCGIRPRRRLRRGVCLRYVRSLPIGIIWAAIIFRPITSLGIRHAVFGYRADDIGGMLENIVYLELLRRGHRVSVGRIDDLEIDFIAEKSGKKEYYQVSYMPSATDTLKRECTPLLSIQDGYPKFLLSMDRFLGVDYNGIACHYLPEWLCNGTE